MKNNSYRKIYKFLKNKQQENINFEIDDLAQDVNLKVSTIKVYIRNKLKNKFITPPESKSCWVLDEIDNYDETSFIAWMSQKNLTEQENLDLSDHLINNSLQAMLSAVEIHNKPQFNYRYQVVVMLIINSWELAMKSYISKYSPETKLIFADDTTKPFLDCASHIEAKLGKVISPTIENIRFLYKYRCQYTHFFSETLDVIIFSLVQKSIVFYNNFISIYFNKDLSKYDNLYILPIAFKKPVSPLDFLSNDSFTSEAPEYVKDFLSEILEKTGDLSDKKIDEMIFVPYIMNLSNVNRVKNADIIAAISSEGKVKIGIEEIITISNDKDAKEKILVEEDIYGKVYTLGFKEICSYCKHNIIDWKQNELFYSILECLKKDNKCSKARPNDPRKPEGKSRYFYHPDILGEIKKQYDSIPI